MYECDPGYSITGGDSERIRTCTDNDGSLVGRWSGTAALCSGTLAYACILQCIFHQ